MHSNRLSHIIFLQPVVLFSFFSVVTGCVSKPPVVEIIGDSEDAPMVGTPGSVAFPEARKRENDSEVVEKTEDSPVGCTSDSQCKGDRVCIAGACVSPQYAADYEAKFMASAGVAEGVESVNENPIIEVQLPPNVKRKLTCKSDNMSRCMKKCDGGNLSSCYSVGKIYETHPDSPNASQYGVYAYRKACDGGDALSCVLLSRMYFVGNLVEQNLGLAFSLNVDGCVLKNMYACANAAVFLENGIGVDQNADMAAEYYTQACIYGHDPSCAKAKTTDGQ